MQHVATAETTRRRRLAVEAAQDIFYGQSVIIWARWFVILAIAVLALWSTTELGQLTIAILAVAALMAINFYVHGRYLVKKPANRLLLILLSVMDIVIISGIVFLWERGTANGLQSQFFVLYYPIILAFAFVFPARLSIPYTLVTLVIYTGLCILVDPSFLGDSQWLERLVIRLITLAAMGALGTFYYRIQRQRRERVEHEELQPI